MEIIISGRSFPLDDAIKTHVKEKVAKLEEEYPKLTTARVVLDSERNWRIAEAHLNGKHLSLDAKARTKDAYAAVDAAVEKLERQLRKYLERVQDHHVDKEKAQELLAEEGPSLRPAES